MHDTNWDVPLTREQQFQLDWTNHARWAPGPVGSREQYRREWEALHETCPDCKRERRVPMLTTDEGKMLRWKRER